MSKSSRENNKEKSVCDKIDRDLTNKYEKDIRDDIKIHQRKYEVVIRSQNVYSVLNEIYKVLLKKNKVLHDEIKNYFIKKVKILTIENIFEKVEDYVDFVGEDENRCRFILYLPGDFKQLKIK